MSYLTKQGLQYFLQKIKEKIDSIRSPKPSWNSPEDSESGILGRTHYANLTTIVEYNISSNSYYNKDICYFPGDTNTAFRIYIRYLARSVTLYRYHKKIVVNVYNRTLTFEWLYVGSAVVLRLTAPPSGEIINIYIEAIDVAKKLHSGYIDDDIARTYQLEEKQATLVSGENIKTVNGESLLGEGNLDIISDWDAREGEAGYVKNRPFYAEFSEDENYSERWTNGRLSDVYGSNLYIKVCANQLSVIETDVAPVWDYFHLTPNDVGFEKHNLRFDGQWEEDIFSWLIHMIDTEDYDKTNIYIATSAVSIKQLPEVFVPNSIARVEQLKELTKPNTLHISYDEIGTDSDGNVTHDSSDQLSEVMKYIERGEDTGNFGLLILSNYSGDYTYYISLSQIYINTDESSNELASLRFGGAHDSIYGEAYIGVEITVYKDNSWSFKVYEI